MDIKTLKKEYKKLKLAHDKKKAYFKAYFKAYRQKNKDKCKAYMRAYYLRNKKKLHEKRLCGILLTK